MSIVVKVILCVTFLEDYVYYLHLQYQTTTFSMCVPYLEYFYYTCFKPTPRSNLVSTYDSKYNCVLEMVECVLLQPWCE